MGAALIKDCEGSHTSDPVHIVDTVMYIHIFVL